MVSASEITILSGFTNLTASEQQTAQDEWHLIGEALTRKAKCLEDDMKIAESLTRIREKHGYKSKLYNSLLEWLGSVSPAWQDKDYRHLIKKAYEGYKVLRQCGSKEEVSKSLSKIESQAALREVAKCKKPFELASALQRRGGSATAQDIKIFNKTGKFIPCSKIFEHKPKQNVKEESEIDQALLTALRSLKAYPHITQLISEELSKQGY